MKKEISIIFISEQFLILEIGQPKDVQLFGVNVINSFVNIVHLLHVLPVKMV